MPSISVNQRGSDRVRFLLQEGMDSTSLCSDVMVHADLAIPRLQGLLSW